MATINALHNVITFTSWKIVVGWTIEQKKQEKPTLEDLFALGVTSQSVELSLAKKKIIGTSRWQTLQQKCMLIIK
jgi:hypothetical protein